MHMYCCVCICLLLLPEMGLNYPVQSDPLITFAVTPEDRPDEATKVMMAERIGKA